MCDRPGCTFCSASSTDTPINLSNSDTDVISNLIYNLFSCNKFSIESCFKNEKLTPTIISMLQDNELSQSMILKHDGKHDIIDYQKLKDHYLSFEDNQEFDKTKFKEWLRTDIFKKCTLDHIKNGIFKEKMMPGTIFQFEYKGITYPDCVHASQIYDKIVISSSMFTSCSIVMSIGEGSEKTDISYETNIDNANTVGVITPSWCPREVIMYDFDIPDIHTQKNIGYTLTFSSPRKTGVRKWGDSKSIHAENFSSAIYDSVFDQLFHIYRTIETEDTIETKNVKDIMSYMVTRLAGIYVLSSEDTKFRMMCINNDHCYVVIFKSDKIVLSHTSSADATDEELVYNDIDIELNKSIIIDDYTITLSKKGEEIPPAYAPPEAAPAPSRGFTLANDGTELEEVD